MMTKIGTLLLSALAVLALPLAAQAQSAEHPVVLELYTSQGCSSCPPADALLAQLSRRNDVIALALHVDYWDYIGWKDSFADPMFTKRQKSYARAAGKRSVVTPQMVVDGAELIAGAMPDVVADKVRQHGKRARPVDLDIRRSGGQVQISATSRQRFSPPLNLQLVRYVPSAMVEVTKGENRGRTLSHANIVTDWSVIATWDGAAPLDMRVPVSGDQPVVVILQHPGPALIEAAAVLR